MAPSPRVVMGTTFGAWLIKASPDAHPVGRLTGSHFATIDAWCVRPSYRSDLIEADQPVLFWISGASRAQPAGIYAEGRTTGGVVGGSGPDERGKPSMPVELRPLTPPVLRTDLVAHPVLSRIEVLRMAAGSNPSFITRADLAALRSAWPQVTVGP